MHDKSVWEVGILGGIVTTLFGIAAVFWPSETLLTLLYLFAAYVLVLGVLNFINGTMGIGRRTGGWFLELIMGVVEVGVGVYLVRHTHLTFATFILLIGFTLVAKGLVEVVSAFIDNYTNEHKALAVLVGLLSMAVGIVVLFQPESSGVAFVWLLGLYALITGPVLTATSLRMRDGGKVPASRR